ncbi:E3 ubiquitin ligase complex SCF subunit sconC, partial [Intoshia linei]
MRKVILQSMDGDQFTVDLDVACQSGMIKLMFDAENDGIEQGNESEPIPLPKVSGSTLKKIIQWCEYHRHDENVTTTSEIGNRIPKEEVITSWEHEYFKLDQGTMFEIIIAANYLDIKRLLDVSCMVIANMIKGRTPEEIRKHFNIKNDLTEAEEDMKHFEATKINEGSSGSTVSSRVLTEEDLTRIKTYRKQKDLHRVYKAAESRKHLANIRVVQKNLIFVVGLSQRLANESVLMGEKFLGQFGHIHKVAINHSTLYAGTMGPSASAYVTYVDSVSALRAIKCLNKVFIDDREIKASLGTTKYCSSYLRWVKCSKK